MAIVASAPSLNDFQLRIVDTFRYDYGHPQLDEKIIQYAPNETPSSPGRTHECLVFERYG